MSKKVSPIPEGLHSLTPYLVLPGCAKIGHAELRIGDSVLYCADAHPPLHPATTAMLCLYVEDCDAVFARAVEAGAKVVMPLEDKFYGDRAGMVADAFGQQWSIATHKEDLSPEQLAERAKKAMPH